VAVVEIEGFDSITGTLILAKELYDIQRFDIVENHFSDVLSWDSYYENIFGVITSVFSGFHITYDENDETECVIFSDDCISSYYEMAWEYGRIHHGKHDENPLVNAAEQEASLWLDICCSMDWRLLGYTKTKKTARQSKLIVHLCACDCDCHDHLAYGLIRLYKWFSDQVAAYRECKEVTMA
jgi:hypothetical protein